jgi:hypothetical protein
MRNIDLDATQYCAEHKTDKASMIGWVYPGVCTLSIDTLLASPFGLVGGEHVYAKITCKNTIGVSIDSEIRNGAVIPKIPDQVPDLVCTESLNN